MISTSQINYATEEDKYNETVNMDVIMHYIYYLNTVHVGFCLFELKAAQQKEFLG